MSNIIVLYDSFIVICIIVFVVVYYIYKAFLRINPAVFLPLIESPVEEKKPTDHSFPVHRGVSKDRWGSFIFVFSDNLSGRAS